MSLRLSHLAFACLALLGLGTFAQAAMNADSVFTQRGQTDFDTVLPLLNPYGTWSKIGGKWAYTPLDHQAPYTDGRWIYTEFGWYWKGRLPHSWITEHYGYWKCGANKVWSWYPGPFWLPEIVEMRASTKYIGWRSGEVDQNGSFVETPIDRFSKPEEWTFVTLEQFANPITPKIVAPLAVATQELDDSTDSVHTYLTYREIDRPGPHPADLAGLCQDGGMLAPLTMQERMAAARAAAAAPAPASASASPSAPAPPAPAPSPSPAPTTPSPAATTNYAAHMTGTNAPTLIGATPDGAVDERQVKYWVTMSLPTFWTKPPPDARPDQIYVYRPDFFQDEDGIGRRISYWFNPKERGTLRDLLGSSMPTSKPDPAPSPDGPAAPATPAIPAESEAGNAFRSPLDEGPSSEPSRTPNTSSKAPSQPAAVPDGLAPQK